MKSKCLLECKRWSVDSWCARSTRSKKCRLKSQANTLRAKSQTKLSMVSMMRMLPSKLRRTPIRQAQYIPAHGKVVLGMETARWCGQTQQDTRGSGSSTRRAVKGSFSILMVTFMMANGKTIRQMDSEFTQIPRAPDTRAPGKMISKTERELKRGLKAQSTTENTCSLKRRDTDCTPGPMEAPMKANGSIIRSTATVSTCGRMAASSMVSGSTTICRASVSTFTQMVSATTVSTWTIRRRAMGSTFGQMAASTRAGGTRASSTV